jgi:hypothetical protein
MNTKFLRSTLFSVLALSTSAIDASNFREDVTVNGSINASDVSSVKLKSGTALP